MKRRMELFRISLSKKGEKSVNSKYEKQASGGGKGKASFSHRSKQNLRPLARARKNPPLGIGVL